MTNEMIYLFLALVLLIPIAFFIFRSRVTTVVQTKEQKREEIMNGYKKQLQDALLPLKDDQQARMSMKSKLLKNISHELARNIFFDQSEIREIILELSLE